MKFTFVEFELSDLAELSKHLKLTTMLLSKATMMLLD
jgi:hypothetical protein